MVSQLPTYALATIPAIILLHYLSSRWLNNPVIYGLKTGFYCLIAISIYVHLGIQGGIINSFRYVGF